MNLNAYQLAETLPRPVTHVRRTAESDLTPTAVDLSREQFSKTCATEHKIADEIESAAGSTHANDQDRMKESEINSETILENAILSLSKSQSSNQNIKVALEILKTCKPVVVARRANIAEADESVGKLASAWNQVAPPEIAKHARPIRLTNRILFIAIDRHEWLTEIVRYHRRPLLEGLKEAVPGMVNRLSFRLDFPAELDFRFTLPLPVWKLCKPIGEELKDEERDQAPVQQCIKNVLQTALPAFRVDVSLDPEPLPQPTRVRIPCEQHFLGCRDNEPVEEHFFGQLNLDLQSAIFEARRLIQAGRLDPLDAFQQGVTRVAAQRWAAYKSAQKTADERAMNEMHAFGTFWYDLAREIRGL